MIGQAQTNSVHIDVLIVDDHPVSRAGLGLFVSAHSDLRLVGEAACGEEALALCEQLKPDVVVMDMRLPGMDGSGRYRCYQAALSSYSGDCPISLPG
jgi:DNA-binding NarL/FixJ family response regulator